MGQTARVNSVQIMVLLEGAIRFLWIWPQVSKLQGFFSLLIIWSFLYALKKIALLYLP